MVCEGPQHTERVAGLSGMVEETDSETLSHHLCTQPAPLIAVGHITKAEVKTGGQKSVLTHTHNGHRHHRGETASSDISTHQAEGESHSMHMFTDSYIYCYYYWAVNTFTGHRVPNEYHWERAGCWSTRSRNSQLVCY